MKTINDARNEAADILRLDLLGTKGNNLSQADYFRLESAMADLVVSVPDDYQPAVVEWAKKHITGPFYRKGPETQSLREAAGIFVGEFVKQGQSINPFSEQNRGTTRNVTIFVILLGAVAFFAVLAGRSKAALQA